MQRQNLLHGKARALFNFGTNTNTKFSIPKKKQITFCLMRKPKVSSSIKSTSWLLLRFGPVNVRVAAENHGQLSEEDDDDDVCPVDCVREFSTDKELFRILESAKATESLVVVDFYRTSCGSCKYIEQGFKKLCKGAGGGEAGVIFLKHNVMDEYDEQSEVAERLRIKTVPLFHLYKDGRLLEAFPTRDKERITAAISKYTSATFEGV